MWREAILKEFGDITKHKVYRRYARSKIPENKRCVKCKRVFNIKRDGRFRARLVACGYSQVPGINFVENFSLVINNVTLTILIILMLAHNLRGKIVDVETAFLYGKLEEKIFMEIPPGMEKADPDDILMLDKSIYGLVQASRQWHKKMVKILKECGFKKSEVDPCLFLQKFHDGKIYVAIYVDDNLVIGPKKGVKKTIDCLNSKGLSLKIQDNLKDYLLCNIKVNRENQQAILTQPHLIKNLEWKMGSVVKDMKSYLTPGTPGMILVKINKKEVESTVSTTEHNIYRSTVGMLLYLVKHLRPDIANAVRELSKVLDKPSYRAYKEMCRVSKYVLDTHRYGLKFSPTKEEGKPWIIHAYSDSDYAGDKDT